MGNKMSINLEKFNMNINKEIEFNEDLWIKMEYNDILYIISKFVRDYRNENNIRQEELAEKLNVSQPMIAKLESGQYNPTIEFLVKLWNKLSTNKENAGKKLLQKICDKVDDNYNCRILK